MLVHEFGTLGLPRADQLDCWRDLMDQWFVPIRLRSATGSGFSASARVLAWDGVQISAPANPSGRALTLASVTVDLLSAALAAPLETAEAVRRGRRHMRGLDPAAPPGTLSPRPGHTHRQEPAPAAPACPGIGDSRSADCVATTVIAARSAGTCPLTPFEGR